MPEPLDPAKTLPLANSERIFHARYRLRSEISRGGMGVVWRADDIKLNRPVALKVLPDLVVRDREAMADLAAETRRCLELTHPNIVRVYDLVAESDQAAISMELVDGPSLAERKLDQPGRCFTPDTLTPWIMQLCSALFYAHTKVRIVHRDLKPLNLLVNSEGDLKIVDFGIARSLRESATRLSATLRSPAVSLAYAGPQQLLGEPAAVADDIYSLGVTLYELLTGRPPFYEGDIVAQVREIVPPPMAARRTELGVAGRGEIPAAWEDTVAACLAKNASDRPPSAAAVATRLGLALPGVATDEHGESFSSLPDHSRHPPASAGIRPTPAPSTRAIRAWAGVGAAAVLAALAIAYWPRHAAPENSARSASAPGSRPSTPPGPRDPAPTAAPSAPVASPSPAPESSVTAGPPTSARGTIELRQGNGPFRLPGAVVRIDGREVAAPQGRVEDIAVGLHEAEIAHRNFETWKQTVTVRDGAVVLTSVKLTPKPGVLTLTVTGPATYKLTANGKAAPVKNGRTNLPVNEKHALEISAPGFKTDRRVITLLAGRPQNLAVTLEKIAVPVPGRPWTVPDLALTLLPIAAGNFAMGSKNGEDNERPITQVTLSQPFWLGKTEVTQREWQALMSDTNRSRFKGDDLPVQNVTWVEAVEFCRKLTAREQAADRLPTDYVYTLPTEAQWEYACRAGTTGEFSGNIADLAWHDANSGNAPHLVATRQPNAWGLYDMHGNVWEWCADWYAKNLRGGTVADPTGPAFGNTRVRRGGSWVITEKLLRSSIRGLAEPDDSNHNLGFRLALASAR